MTLSIHAPTDNQLAYIADLCHSLGFPFPDAVSSSQEASEIISALRTGNYRPEDYAMPFEARS